MRTKPSTFDHPIADLLRERGLTVHALAQYLGITERSIYYWYNGTPVPLRHVARMADFFGVPPDYFMNMDRPRESR